MIKEKYTQLPKSRFWYQLVLFVVVLLLIIAIREYISFKLIENGVESYRVQTYLKLIFNLILIIVSCFFINKNGLEIIAGIKGAKLTKWYLLLFPLFYLVLLNLFTMDRIDKDIFIPDISTLVLYSISIGIAEELSIHGFLQSYLINGLEKTKRNVIFSVFVASLFFGLIHLLNFDKGLYGELSQVCYASFIGAMFGILLVITKRIYPLIIIHSVIDFFAKLDSTGLPIKEKVSETMSAENAVFIVLLVLPCLIYGIFLMKSYPLIDGSFATHNQHIGKLH